MRKFTKNEQRVLEMLKTGTIWFKEAAYWDNNKTPFSPAKLLYTPICHPTQSNVLLPEPVQVTTAERNALHALVLDGYVWVIADGVESGLGQPCKSYILPTAHAATIRQIAELGSGAFRA